MRRIVWLVLFGVFTACSSQQAAVHSSAVVDTGACSMAAATPWITRWFEAWDLASREIMHLPDAPTPNMIFFDSTCVYTTAKMTVPGVKPVAGPALRGKKLQWYAAAHHDSLTMPNGAHRAVALMSFADSDKKSGPYFVMAAPSYWEKRVGADPFAYTGVFLHEFAHTRQIHGMAAVIGPIDKTWKDKYKEELDDDVVQRHFEQDSVYVAAYLAERDLLYRAASAGTIDESRGLAQQALDMMRSRHARWFTGDKAVFATLDDTFLSLEGSAQWTASAWLAHPKGGGIEGDKAAAKMRGKGRWWSQDEGLGLFLAVNRLWSDWPAPVFGDHSPGATELLERAIRESTPRAQH